MLDNFTKEGRICNLLHKYLNERGYRIIQLVYPGGQATLSIRYRSALTNSARIVFPDLIAILETSILIGEVKPKFSLADKSKLLDIANSSDGVENIKSLIRRVTKLNVDQYSLTFLLIHGDNSAMNDPLIEQLILTE